MSAPLRQLAVLGKLHISRVLAGATPQCQCGRGFGAAARWQQYIHTQLNLKPQTMVVTQVRYAASFLNRMNAGALWEGVIGVSAAGRKRGRGKRVGRKKSTDLNKGQVMGKGRLNVVWPGLNSPVIKGSEVMRIHKLPENPDYQDQLVKLRDEMGRIRYPALAPLERGWSGSRFPGQSHGPPDKVADYEFVGFDTRILEFKLVTNMSGTLGRKQRFTVFVVAGNKNGLAGYGLGRSQNARTAIRVAKNRAAQKLRYIDLFENHTVHHNMYNRFHHTKIFIHKKEKGYGLRCHRALKTICELIGIKDLHAKVEGSTGNIQALTKGFFEALDNQETHQELSDRTKYHVVQFRQERKNFPEVVASPQDGKVRQEKLKDEEEDLELNFDRLYYGGKVELKKPPWEPPYTKTKSWRYKRAEMHMRRGQEEAALLRKANMW